MSRIRRLTTIAVGTLAAAALAAGPAVAQSDDLRSPDARAAGEPVVTAPADPGAQDLRTPDARAAGKGATPVVVHVDRAADDSGVSWDSAAIGALIASGVLIALPGAVMLLGRRRTRPAV